MKKIVTLALMVTVIMGLVGCSKEPGGDPSSNGQDYFNGKVLAVYDTYVDVECLDVTTGAITEGTQLSVTLNVASANEVPEIEVGDEIRVVFSNVMESDPPKLGTVWGIYMLDEEGNVAQEQSLPTPANSDVDWGITLSVDNVTSKGLTLYIIQTGGEPTGELRYGSDYHLQVLEDGNWRDVPYATQGDVGWNDEGYMVVMDAATPLDIYWERLYGSLPAGTYRISKGFMDFRASGDYDSQSFYAEFEIKEPQEQSLISIKECRFHVQYIRTDGYQEGVEYPIVRIIRSVDELADYYEEYKEIYNLERRENPASDSTIGFLDACDKYDDAYFEKQILVMVLLEEGSGSVRHKVSSVETKDSNLIINIESIVPETGTEDMAEWHILIETEENVAVSSEEDVVIILDGREK